MIIVDDVHFSYDGLYPALRGVSLQIVEGERIAIMGANGAGKTTLVKQMNGLLRPQSGTVFLKGRDTTHMSVAEIARVVEPDDDCGVEVKAIEATKQHLLTGDPRPTFDRGARACF